MTLYLADVSALVELNVCLDGERSDEIWSELTRCVEEGLLGFPKAVVNDLKVLARKAQVLAWAEGLGQSLNAFKPHVKHARWLMRKVSAAGFDLGFDSIDGEEPSITQVCLCARQLNEENSEFVIVTQDDLEGPLGPSMRQLCDMFGWNSCSMRHCLKEMSLGQYLQSDN